MHTAVFCSLKRQNKESQLNFTVKILIYNKPVCIYVFLTFTFLPCYKHQNSWTSSYNNEQAKPTWGDFKNDQQLNFKRNNKVQNKGFYHTNQNSTLQMFKTCELIRRFYHHTNVNQCFISLLDSTDFVNMNHFIIRSYSSPVMFIRKRGHGNKWLDIYIKSNFCICASCVCLFLCSSDYNRVLL